MIDGPVRSEKQVISDDDSSNGIYKKIYLLGIIF